MRDAAFYLVLPKANDLPAKHAEFAEVALVTGAIGTEFVAPERRKFVFPCGQPPAVPEISIHEHGDFFFGENDVGVAGQRANVTTESQSLGAKLLLHQLLQ